MFYMRSKGTFPAAVLAIVLIVGTLLLLGICMILALWDQGRLEYARYGYERRQYDHLESAFVLYCTDSLASRGIHRLFPEEEDSEVEVLTGPWGLYEIVRLSAGKGEAFRQVRMAGKQVESFYRTVFWYSDRGRPVLLGGNTDIRGKTHLPRSGVVPVQVGPVFFGGNLPDSSGTEPSAPQFPKSGDEFYPGEIPGNEAGNNTDSLTWSFWEKTRYVEIEKEACFLYRKGNVVLYAGEKVEIDRSCHLEDVLLLAPSVKFGKGFRGKVQVFARDSVILEEGVRLEYPSGIYVQGRTHRSMVRMGENCSVKGYVILEIPEEPAGEWSMHYHSGKTSEVEGLLYVDGNAALQGYVRGSTWLRDCYYVTSSGYYPELLYDVHLTAGKQIAYPLWLEGPYRRKFIAWLY